MSPQWNTINTISGLSFLLMMGACAKGDITKPNETAEMVLLRVIAASSENSCTHVLRASSVKTDDMTSGTIVFLSLSEASRTYRRHKEKCFKMIDEEMSKLGIKN